MENHERVEKEGERVDGAYQERNEGTAGSGAISCSVIRDLLPLYLDEVCSEESRKLVEEHLTECGGCRRLRDEMGAEISKPLSEPELDSRALFHRLHKKVWQLVLVVSAAFVMLFCFAVNVGSAWRGGPADWVHLVTTVLYLLFWGVFTVMSHRQKVLGTLSYLVSLLTAIAACNGLFWSVSQGGGFLAGYIAVFAAIPFYGLRRYLSWTGLYLTATVVSLVWLVYTGWGLREFGKKGKTEK